LDRYWDKLSAGGDQAAQQCGWLKDKYGLSWQIVPAALAEMICDADPEKSGRSRRAYPRFIARYSSAVCG